jgi:hypothetical protein
MSAFAACLRALRTLIHEVRRGRLVNGQLTITFCFSFFDFRRSKQMKTYVLQPFLIGAAGAYGMSVGYAMFDLTASIFKRRTK